MSEESIPGWSTFLDWFGFEPNFHDAEIVSIDLRRDPEPSIVRIHAWRTTVGEDGFYRHDHGATVSFFLKGISHQELQGWNHQNVLDGVSWKKEEDGYALFLEDCWGAGGEFKAAELWVEIAARDASV